MKIIINAEPDEAQEVLALLLDKRKHFDDGPERLGWGWVWPLPSSGRRFFIRQIKEGLSVSPAKGKTA